MLINIDNCQKTSVSVILKIFPPIEELWVNFSDAPSADVMRELEELCSRPGFILLDYRKKYLEYKVQYPSGWKGQNIAEAIAKCFEQNHGLVVRRQIQSVGTEENVEQFCVTN